MKELGMTVTDNMASVMCEQLGVRQTERILSQFLKKTRQQRKSDKRKLEEAFPRWTGLKPAILWYWNVLNPFIQVIKIYFCFICDLSKTLTFHINDTFSQNHKRYAHEMFILCSCSPNSIFKTAVSKLMP